MEELFGMVEKRLVYIHRNLPFSPFETLTICKYMQLTGRLTARLIAYDPGHLFSRSIAGYSTEKSKSVNKSVRESVPTVIINDSVESPKK